MNGRKKGFGRSSMPGTGEALRLARVRRRLTQAQIGEATGQTGAAIHYYEQENAVPDLVIAMLPKKVRVAVAIAALRGHEAAIAALRKLTR